MSEEEETEEEDEQEDSADSEESSMFEKRVKTIMIIIGGVVAGSVSFFTSAGFTSLAGAFPVLPVSVVILAFIKFRFDDFSGKTVPYVVLLVFFMWFMFGTFALQLV